MTVIGNRFTPPFVGRRPNEPTPAPPGPAVLITAVAIGGLRAAFSLSIDPTGLATANVDWGDGSPRELTPGPYPRAMAHTYADPAVYEIRVTARTAAGRESANSFRVQVGTGAIPDPVADFTIAPAAPTEATPVTLTSIATPAEFIEAWEWTQVMPPGSTQEGPPVMNLGLLPADNYVWSHRVRLTDGRWSTPRARGVTVPATEEPPP
jgi:hypothetical protein